MGLFAESAWHYARYRPGYPQQFFDDVVEHFSLDRTGRLLDLGCGTGQLTLPLADYVTEAVGMDPEPGMLSEAAKRANVAGVTNVTWTQGGSNDLPSNIGPFRLVTMGRSFHWMDREQVLTALDSIVDGDGGLVIANDSCLVRPTTQWQRAVEDVQNRFIPMETLTNTTGPVSKTETHEAILARSPFRDVRRTTYAFDRSWTIEQAIGYLYSTSLPLRRSLGERRAAFEQAITDTLIAIDPKGQFTEPVTLEVLTATR
ncbi:methyltransferase type 11 [Mycobacterium sp. ACS1612]|nr:methyltransferase type 11 [Mycobacterium sp. ACS1612]